MKVLWITYDLPYPPNSGGKLRAYHLLKSIGQKFEVTLFSYFRSPFQLLHLSEVEKIVSHLRIFRRRYVWDIRNIVRAGLSSQPLLTVSYLNRELFTALDSELKEGNYDLVHLEFLGVAWVMPLVKKLGKKVVFGNENVEYQIYQKYAQQQKNPILKKLMEFDVEKMRRLEERLWRLADVNLAVSRKDAAVMSAAGARNCYLVPNGVDTNLYRKFAKSVGQPPKARALFTGNLGYQQNNEAVRWFVREVLPLIRRRLPDFKLVVVSGSKPDWVRDYESVIDFRQDENSQFTDFVDEADVFVLPVWIKSGTNIKLLQAMAVGFPVVSTSAGITGYDLPSSGGPLVADRAEDFADKVMALLGDVSLRGNISREALKIAAIYDWERSAALLGEIYEKI